MPVILITGASSGIGAALARHYAAPGTHLVLNARGIDRLNTVAAACRDLGATVATRSLDVRDRQTVGEWLRETHAATPLDLVIVNAGINGGHPGGDIETEAMAFETVDVNLNGALNVALPCVTLMLARGSGQIALISSLAAFAPLPDAPAYSGTKAALLAHGLALRAKLGPRGVRMNVVTPGYVKNHHGWGLRGLASDGDECRGGGCPHRARPRPRPRHHRLPRAPRLPGTRIGLAAGEPATPLHARFPVQGRA